ncbi:MAG: hypothetical protein M1823_001097 [Watsoniomyces obsoletus]|nr:MAG: hypothetical protein M1823_001097 [Watsoniomyces obsoletus]
MDAFLDFDQLPSTTSSSSSTNMQVQGTTNANSTLMRATGSSIMSNQAPSFAGPSHQYDHYKQQTGLPVGALDLLAVHPTTDLSLFHNTPELDFGAGDQFFDAGVLGDDLMNGGSSSSRHASFGTASEMDLSTPDPEPFPAFFLPETTNSTAAEFIDPSALAAPEEVTTPMPLQATPRAQVGRLWPGIHQQQAALAKARQQQRQQQQQQPQHHQQRAMGSISGQQPLPQLDSATASGRSVASQPSHPMSDERISRLLSSMRQASVAGSSDGGATPHADGHGSHGGRMRKDEEDMDEDERLLASEEGKKLSSKERRQLRNKVSARAFRSRRKGRFSISNSVVDEKVTTNICFVEYIGQLEAELSAKAKESNDLRQENRALRDENTRLSDLTRMLLGSPAFSGFLEQLSTNGGASSAPTQTSSSAPAANDSVVGGPSVAPTPKDVNPSQAQWSYQAPANPTTHSAHHTQHQTRIAVGGTSLM